MLVVGNLRQHMRPRHSDLDGFLGQRRHHAEFISQPKINVVEDAAPACRCRMEDIWVVGSNRLRLGHALECGNLLPEVIEHGVGRRMPVVRASVHFATGDDVDAGQFLVQDRGLASAILRVHHRCHRQLTDRDEPIQ
jgi:hypothetical protein